MSTRSRKMFLGSRARPPFVSRLSRHATSQPHRLPRPVSFYVRDPSCSAGGLPVTRDMRTVCGVGWPSRLHALRCSSVHRNVTVSATETIQPVYRQWRPTYSVRCKWTVCIRQDRGIGSNTRISLLLDVQGRTTAFETGTGPPFCTGAG
jgi:hypothetical protein